MSPDALRDVDPARYEALRFDLHPACALVQSELPHHAHLARESAGRSRRRRPSTSAAAATACWCCARRNASSSIGCPPATSPRSRRFARGANLGAAFEAAQAADATFDLGAALRHFMGLNILTGIELPPAASPRSDARFSTEVADNTDSGTRS